MTTQRAECLKLVVYRDYDAEAQTLPALLPLPDSVAALRRHVEAATRTRARLLSYWSYATRRYEVLERTAQLRQPAALLPSSSSSTQQQQQNNKTTTTTTLVYRAQLWLETTLLTLEPVDVDVEREEFIGLQQHVRRYAGGTSDVRGSDNDDDDDDNNDNDSSARVRYDLVRATRVRCDYFARQFDRLRSEQLARTLSSSSSSPPRHDNDNDNSSSSKAKQDGSAAVQLLFYSNNAWRNAEVLRCGFALCARPPPWLLAASDGDDDDDDSGGRARLVDVDVDDDDDSHTPRRRWCNTLQTPFVFASSALPCDAYARASRLRGRTPSRRYVLLCEVAPGRVYMSRMPLLPPSSSLSQSTHGAATTTTTAAPLPPPGYDSVQYTSSAASSSSSRRPVVQLCVGHSHQALPRYLLVLQPHIVIAVPRRGSVDQLLATRRRRAHNNNSDKIDDDDDDDDSDGRQRDLARAATVTPQRHDTHNSSSRRVRAQRPRSPSASAKAALLLWPPTPSPHAQRSAPTHTPERLHSQHGSDDDGGDAVTHSAAMLLEAAPPANAATATAAATTARAQQSPPRQQQALQRQVTWRSHDTAGNTRQDDSHNNDSSSSDLVARTTADALSDDDNDDVIAPRHARTRSPRRVHSRAGSVRHHRHRRRRRALAASEAGSASGSVRSVATHITAAAAVSTSVPAALLCTVHPRRATTLYCRTCSELICAHCASVGVHAGHDVDSADAQALRLQARMQALCHRLTTALDAHTRAHAQLTMQRGDVQRRRRQRAESLRLRIAELHRAIDARAQALRRELHCDDVDDDDAAGEAVTVIVDDDNDSDAADGNGGTAKATTTTTLTTTLAATEATVWRARAALQAALRPLERALHAHTSSRRLSRTASATALRSTTVRSHNSSHSSSSSSAGGTARHRYDDGHKRSHTSAAAHRARTTATLLFVKQAPRLLDKAEAVLTTPSSTQPRLHAPPPPSSSSSSLLLLLSQTTTRATGGKEQQAAAATSSLVAPDDRVLTRVQRVIDAVCAAQHRDDEQLARLDVTVLRRVVEQLDHTHATPHGTTSELSSSTLQPQHAHNNNDNNNNDVDTRASLSEAWHTVRRLERNLADLQRGHLWCVQRASYYFAPSQHRTVSSTPFCLLGVEWELRIAPAHTTTRTTATATDTRNNNNNNNNNNSNNNNNDDEDEWLGLYLCPRSHRMRVDFRVIAFSDVAWHAWEVRGWAEAYAGKPWGLCPFLQRKALMRTDKLARNDTVKLCVTPMTGLY